MTAEKLIPPKKRGYPRTSAAAEMCQMGSESEYICLLQMVKPVLFSEKLTEVKVM